MIPANEEARPDRAGAGPVDFGRRSAAGEHPGVRPSHGAHGHREVRARERAPEVDEKILDAAREFFGM